MAREGNGACFTKTVFVNLAAMSVPMPALIQGHMTKRRVVW